jgi:hypothetical protein
MIVDPTPEIAKHLKVVLLTSHLAIEVGKPSKKLV